MNGDMPLRERRFRDLSTAINMPLLVATFGVALCQVAVLQHWLQTAHGIALIVMRDGKGVGYIDHFVAVLDSLAVVSLFLSIPSFATGGNSVSESRAKRCASCARNPFKTCLCALVNTGAPMAAPPSAAALLLSAGVVDCLPALLRWLQHAPDEARIKTWAR